MDATNVGKYTIHGCYGIRNESPRHPYAYHVVVCRCVAMGWGEVYERHACDATAAGIENVEVKSWKKISGNWRNRGLYKVKFGFWRIFWVFDFDSFFDFDMFFSHRNPMNYQTFTLGTHTQTSQESYPLRCGFSARTSGLLREIGWMALGKLGGWIAGQEMDGSTSVLRWFIWWWWWWWWCIYYCSLGECFQESTSWALTNWKPSQFKVQQKKCRWMALFLLNQDSLTLKTAKT